MSSNNRSILTGRQNNTLRAVVYDTDGTIKTDLAHDTTGISLYIQRIGAADGTPITSFSAKATPQTAHADGALLNLGGGDISVDWPDAPFVGYVGQARIYGTFTGGIIVGEWYDVVGYDPSLAAVGANTVVPTNLSAAQVRTELATELARIDAAISSRADTGTVNDLAQSIPSASVIATAVWQSASRTLTTISNSSGITTLLDRITGLLRTKAEDEAAETAQTAEISTAIADIPTVAQTEAAFPKVARQIGDETPVLFTFPTGSLLNANFTKTRRINGGVSAAVQGAITYLYELDGRYWYSLAYNANDRPSAPGVVQYVIADGTDDCVVQLQVVDAPLTTGKSYTHTNDTNLDTVAVTITNTP